MSKMNLFFNFTAYCSIWGAGIGFFLGVIYFFFYGLWAYSILGLIINLIVGWVIGIFNGLALGFLYSIVSNIKTARLTSLICSIVVTFTASFTMYFVIYSPLSSDLQRTVIVSLPVAIIATTLGAFFSQRAFIWYPRFEGQN
jgi:hypothetical protein